ncbi:MAG: hypothetical protein GVY17_02235 [Cyanobacteria bacterium]|jgi:WD40 repeat protein|nr:hypothetical protein [Cyanobacteria bacterium GSL.Bin21]
MRSRIAFQPTGESRLSDYISAIAWSPTGKLFAVSSASGEVALFSLDSFVPVFLQSANDYAVNCLAFSSDGQFLASAGQSGQVKIWEVSSDSPQVVATLDYPATWIDCLVWNRVNHQLAFSLGKYVQVWDAMAQEIVTTLNFETSSVLDLDWRSDGLWLAVGGYQATQVWNTQDWDDDPELIEVPSASIAVKWSPDARYLACGNLDQTLLVTEWGNPNPWLMQGFTGKVRQLAWSAFPNRAGAPLLAASSGNDIVVWERSQNKRIGWSSEAVSHEEQVAAMAFHPQSLRLASVGKDGWLHFWHRGQKLLQSFNPTLAGFSDLSWHPQGHHLVAGSEGGEVWLWSQTKSGRGFG